MPHDTIAVLDYGSQTAQLIARRIREVGVYSELHPWDAPRERVLGPHVRGLILSGGPNSVYATGECAVRASGAKPCGRHSMRSPWLIHTSSAGGSPAHSGESPARSTVAGPYSRACEALTSPPSVWVRSCMP